MSQEANDDINISQLWREAQQLNDLVKKDQPFSEQDFHSLIEQMAHLHYKSEKAAIMAEKLDAFMAEVLVIVRARVAKDWPEVQDRIRGKSARLKLNEWTG